MFEFFKKRAKRGRALPYLEEREAVPVAPKPSGGQGWDFEEPDPPMKMDPDVLSKALPEVLDRFRDLWPFQIGDMVALRHGYGDSDMAGVPAIVADRTSDLRNVGSGWVQNCAGIYVVTRRYGRIYSFWTEAWRYEAYVPNGEACE
jgi:hypothetical protein